MGRASDKNTKGTETYFRTSLQMGLYRGVIRSVCRDFNYKEMRTPVFEHTSSLSAAWVTRPYIVQKEMYTFEDKGGRSITLVRRAPRFRAGPAAKQPLRRCPAVKLFYYTSPATGTSSRRQGACASSISSGWSSSARVLPLPTPKSS